MQPGGNLHLVMQMVMGEGTGGDFLIIFAFFREVVFNLSRLKTPKIPLHNFCGQICTIFNKNIILLNSLQRGQAVGAGERPEPEIIFSHFRGNLKKKSCGTQGLLWHPG